ncbi:MAG: agmatine deiminase family protein [Gammaproteobacteria bacterium]|nr:agmatine deiminase family protein [Gammaproteobacteria bacterium]
MSGRIDLPAEWEPQDGVLLTWPHAHSDWAPLLPEVEPVFIEIARQIALREQVIISCYHDAHVVHVRRRLEQAGINLKRAHLYIVSSNDTWVRDHGPITLYKNGIPTLLDFTFNGWGGKFKADLDNQVTRHLHSLGAFGVTAMQTLDMVLEGGGIEVDGAGSLLTTESCLLSPQRNPHLNKHQIEERLKAIFGIERVLWLKHGQLAGDDTDGHIDTLARFCDKQTITYVACDDPRDEHYAELQAMEAELKLLRTREGNPYRLVPLPWPQAKFSDDGKRLPASYANFLIINGAVLAPTYDDPADVEVLVRLRTCFPDREVIGIPCLPLIKQYGSLHCVTMQLPAGVLSA